MSWGTKLGLDVLALAPISFLTVGAIDAFDAARFNMSAQPTEAEVLRFVGGAYESRTASKGNFGSYFPELRYTTKGGEEVVSVSTSSRDSEFAMPMETGDVIPARYDPDNVEGVRLWTAGQMFIGPALFVVLWRLFRRYGGDCLGTVCQQIAGSNPARTFLCSSQPASDPDLLCAGCIDPQSDVRSPYP